MISKSCRWLVRTSCARALGCFICKRFDVAGRQLGTSTLTYNPCHVPRNTRGTRLCYRSPNQNRCFGVCLGGPAKRAGPRRENQAKNTASYRYRKIYLRNRLNLTRDVNISKKRLDISQKELMPIGHERRRGDG